MSRRTKSTGAVGVFLAKSTYTNSQFRDEALNLAPSHRAKLLQVAKHRIWLLEALVSRMTV